MTSPRPNPCPSCPYRLDAPSGVWAPEEYAKLRRYDGEIADQAYAGAFRPFSCHSTPALLCSGWVGHREKPGDLLAVRAGVSTGDVDPVTLDYSTSVPLFASGAEAAEHGLREVEAPGVRAREAIRKVVRARPDVRGMSPDRTTDPA